MKAYLKDNRGLTLVELLVAITIFALITIPLLNSFKISARTAAKSELLGRVSMAGQNIMERIEATDISTLMSGAENAKNKLQAGSAKYYKKVGSGYEEGMGGAPYCIWLTDISSGTTTYNAMVEIAPNSRINDEKLSVPTPAQLIFSQSERDPDGISGREIVLKVERDDAHIKSTISYSYANGVNLAEESGAEGDGEGGAGGDGEGGAGGGAGVPGTTNYEGTIENVAPGGSFAIYMLYTPVFAIDDKITIVNSLDPDENLNFDLFLVKKHADSESQEYTCTLNQKGALVNIYTNIADGDGVDVVNINYLIGDLVYPGIPANVKDSVVVKQSKERAHNINIKLYSSDSDFTAEPVFELEGMTID